MMFRGILFVALVGTLAAQTSPRWKDLVERGKELEARYRSDDAIEAYRQAIRLAPNEVAPHLALGKVLMSIGNTLVAPGAPPNPEYGAASRNAEKEFLRVVELDRRNVTALRSLGWLKLTDSQKGEDPAAKQRAADESRGWFQKVLAIETADAEAHTGLGAVAAISLIPEWQATRERLKMKPEDPGPFPDAHVRAALRARFGATIDDGLAHLRRAQEIGQFDTSAIGFTTMLLHDAADLSDTAEEYKRLNAQAEDITAKALAAIRARAGNGSPSPGAAPPPPPQPPPPVKAKNP